MSRWCSEHSQYTESCTGCAEKKSVTPPAAKIPLDFTCEKCGRKPGMPCINANGRIPSTCHRARIVSAVVAKHLDKAYGLTPGEAGER